MNIRNNNDSDYYEKLVLEIGFLQEAIKLPPLPSEELSLSVLEQYARSGKTYNLMQNCYKDMIGKFYIPSLFPLIDKSSGPEEFLHKAPSLPKSNDTLKTDKYTELNYVELIIPKYIVMQFRDVIPKDTMFLIGFNGEHKKLSNLNVVGIYGPNITVEKEKKNGWDYKRAERASWVTNL